MPCHECEELNTHRFRTSDDLVHALRVASSEVDRGALLPVAARERGAPEEEALQSILAANVVPGAIRYQFECAVCGDRFQLLADTSDGNGGWTREGEGDDA